MIFRTVKILMPLSKNENSPTKKIFQNKNFFDADLDGRDKACTFGNM